MTERSSGVVASRKAAEPPANRLLALLPPKDFQRLRPHLHRLPLEYRRSLYRAHRLIGFVYFIETGVGSLVNTMANGQASEVGTTRAWSVCLSCWATGALQRAGLIRYRRGNVTIIAAAAWFAPTNPPRNSLPTLLPTEPAAGHLRDKAGVIFMCSAK